MLYKCLNAVISNVFILVSFRVVIYHRLVKVVFKSSILKGGKKQKEAYETTLRCTFQVLLHNGLESASQRQQMYTHLYLTIFSRLLLTTGGVWICNLINWTLRAHNE
jgi:hypothetical protein